MGTHHWTQISRVLFIALLFYPSLAFFAFSSPADTDIKKGVDRFSGTDEEGTFTVIMGNHRDWMLNLAHMLSDPSSLGNTGLATGERSNWDETRVEINRPGGEAFFGKEFFTLFLQYHQDRADIMSKYINRDFDGAKVLLEKAKSEAEQLKRLPMKNKDSVSCLFVDKMYLEMVIGLAVLECGRGNTMAGLTALRSAGDEAQKAKWHWGKAQAAYYMAVYAEHANLPSAMPFYKNALEISREDKVRDYSWRCCFRLASWQIENGFLEPAISLLEEAIIDIEFMRNNIEEDVRKMAFMGDKFQVYRLLTKALLDKGEIRKALEVSENIKSRVLQDLLDSAHNLTRWGGNCALVTREQVLSENLEALEETQGLNAETQLAALRQEHEYVLSKIREKNPDYGMLKIGASADVDDIQGLLDEKNVLLEYNLLPDCLIAWVVTKNSIRVEKIPIPMGTLIQNVQAVRMMMGKPKSPAVYKLLGQLYGSIIKPFEKDIQEKNLVIVPDGALHYLPFVALMDEEGKFLVERHTISVVPSFTVLKYCMAKKKTKPKSVLAFGNPDLHDAKMDLPNAQLEVKSIAEHFSKLEDKAIAEQSLKPDPSMVLRSDPKADLPNAQLEVKNIAEKFPQTEIYLRKEASETLAKKVLGNFDIIHFACHGEMDAGNSMNSCLRLAPDETNDGKLTAGEIFDLKLNAQLVILSGCETGRGELAGGDEMIGLTRSFLYAGTPCVMVSHWKVDDNATCELMGNFYESLAKSGRAEALRTAQIKTMKTKKHPYFWAAFYLVGDGR